MFPSHYDSQATRHALSNSVTALHPTITPYDWQIDLAETLTLVLDATVIAGSTGSIRHARLLALAQGENRAFPAHFE